MTAPTRMPYLNLYDGNVIYLIEEASNPKSSWEKNQPRGNSEPFQVTSHSRDGKLELTSTSTGRTIVYQGLVLVSDSSNTGPRERAHGGASTYSAPQSTTAAATQPEGAHHPSRDSQSRAPSQPDNLAQVAATASPEQAATVASAQAPYTFTLSKEQLSKAQRYKEDLINGSQTAGRKLQDALFASNLIGSGKLGALSDEEFLKFIISLKEPKNFAEDTLSSEQNAIRAGFNVRELMILASVGTVISSRAYNDGLHQITGLQHHFPAVSCLMGFISAPLLKSGCPDLADVTQNGKGLVIDQRKYTSVLKNRLLPLLLEMSRTAVAQGEKLSLTIPGLGCGQFAGDFARVIRENLRIALEDILTTHANDLPGIARVYLDTFSSEGLTKQPELPPGIYARKLLGSGTVHSILFDCVASSEDSSLRKQLTPSTNPNLSLATIVAADLLSFMGNDGWIDSRKTDEGVKGMSTFVMGQIACYLNPQKYIYTDFYYNRDKGTICHKTKSWSEIAKEMKQFLYANEGTPISVFSLSTMTSTVTAAEAPSNSAQVTHPITTPSTPASNKQLIQLLADKAHEICKGAIIYSAFLPISGSSAQYVYDSKQEFSFLFNGFRATFQQDGGINVSSLDPRRVFSATAEEANALLLRLCDDLRLLPPGMTANVTAMQLQGNTFFGAAQNVQPSAPTQTDNSARVAAAANPAREPDRSPDYAGLLKIEIDRLLPHYQQYLVPGSWLMWEDMAAISYGISRHSNLRGFATEQYQILFATDGSLEVNNKQQNYALVTGTQKESVLQDFCRLMRLIPTTQATQSMSQAATTPSQAATVVSTQAPRNTFFAAQPVSSGDATVEHLEALLMSFIYDLNFTQGPNIDKNNIRISRALDTDVITMHSLYHTLTFGPFGIDSVQKRSGGNVKDTDKLNVLEGFCARLKLTQPPEARVASTVTPPRNSR